MAAGPDSAKYKDAVATLSQWYGPDSIACHAVKIISHRSAESIFTVGQNLCGPEARPPMFNRLALVDGVFRTQTSGEDTKQHFVESVGISVVPGHKITGLMEVAAASQYQPKHSGELYTEGFDFMQFKGLVLPGQELSFTGQISTNENGVTAAFSLEGQRRPFTRNFQVTEGDPLEEAVKRKKLATHWYFEVHSQGLGVAALESLGQNDVAPILLESGPSKFAPIPIQAGDILISHFDIQMSDETQIMGNAQTFVRGIKVAEQQDLLLQIVPIADIKAVIEKEKGGNH